MADFITERIVTMAIDDLDTADRRLVERLMLRVEGVSAYRLADDGLLTVALVDTDEEPLLRALFAAGILARSTEMFETVHMNLGGHRAC